MGKPTKCAIFNSYVKLPEGTHSLKNPVNLPFFDADSQASDVKLGTVTWKSSALKVTPLESCNLTTLDLGQV